MTLNIQLLIAAGGMGERLGHAIPKALVPVAGRPLLCWTLDQFNELSYLEDVVITAPEAYLDDFSSVVNRAYPDKNIQMIPGGRTRQLSILNGLDALNEDTDIVIIHDAARPFPPLDAIKQVIEAAGNYGAATVAISCSDTILRGTEEEMLADTPNRSLLWACQTPQVFRVDVIRDAHAHAQKNNITGTDDATLVRMNNGDVKLIRGSAKNFKITSPEDLKYAAYLLREEHE